MKRVVALTVWQAVNNTRPLGGGKPRRAFAIVKGRLHAEQARKLNNYRTELHARSLVQNV